MAYDGIKLDLACGAKPKDGFTGVDMFHPNAEVKLNLLQFPWPWKDDEVAEIYCSHFIEHIPMVYVEPDGLPGNTIFSQVPIGPNWRDLFERFFDECWRILHPEGVMTVICPTARSNRGFQDPTHRRFIVAETFLYLAKAWRDANELGHYSGSCDFNVVVEPIVPAELGLLHPEAAARKMNNEWNWCLDWKATLTKNPVPKP